MMMPPGMMPPGMMPPPGMGYPMMMGGPNTPKGTPRAGTNPNTPRTGPNTPRGFMTPRGFVPVDEKGNPIPGQFYPPPPMGMVPPLGGPRMAGLTFGAGPPPNEFGAPHTARLRGEDAPKTLGSALASTPRVVLSKKEQKKIMSQIGFTKDTTKSLV
eukprot:TRINITY_DN9197_c0_g1_i1.p1 TRINITY_DN9197_c0_g1~~TRINITY_DN9197_c0_g1_i1.p1  ORF type:complete len:157 (-),score=31.55 TRINITY_DN9197_c0_g1_i1:50-520(-)